VNLLDTAEAAESARLVAHGATYAGCFCGVEMWRVPDQGGHVSRQEALKWLQRKEGERS
jgi:hypothetical protein